MVQSFTGPRLTLYHLPASIFPFFRASQDVAVELLPAHWDFHARHALLVVRRANDLLLHEDGTLEFLVEMVVYNRNTMAEIREPVVGLVEILYKGGRYG